MDDQSPSPIIVSASYKTDIPAFYGPWFEGRLDAGFAMVANPYGGPAQHVPLDAGSVAGFVFWTRNAAPFDPVLRRLADECRPFIVQYTITGYPRPLDAATIGVDAAAAQVRRLAADYGPRAVVWRYDPIVVSTLTPPAWHRRTFATLADAIAGATDEVVVSLAQIYRKTARNLNTAAQQHGFEWTDPADEEKRALLADLAAIAEDAGLRFSLCGQREYLIETVDDARCIDAERLADVAGRPMPAARRAHRRGCGCWSSKDIGAYDTCPHGCTYCYAVSSMAVAKRRFRSHDTSAAFLNA